MFSHFEGVVSEKQAGSLVIDCGGVGYLLQVSNTTLSAAPAVGERMKVYALLSVREDAMELFGFATREERAMFERLRAVSGVGPKMAMQVLSALSLRDLSIALAAGDATALTRVPGIGKKTAQRLVLELRDKVEEGMLTGAGTAAMPTQAAGDAAGEAIEALMALGYTASGGARLVSRGAGQSGRGDELVRLALRQMG